MVKEGSSRLSQVQESRGSWCFTYLYYTVSRQTFTWALILCLRIVDSSNYWTIFTPVFLNPFPLVQFTLTCAYSLVHLMLLLLGALVCKLRVPILGLLLPRQPQETPWLVELREGKCKLPLPNLWWVPNAHLSSLTNHHGTYPQTLSPIYSLTHITVILRQQSEPVL